MENVLVTGSNGQLGSEIHVLSMAIASQNFLFTDVNQLDITKKKQINEFVKKHNISIIINCAAYTNVDGAEKNEQLAVDINFLGAKNLAEVALENKIKLIHISTDYVFDGESSNSYKEDDKTNPKSGYGATKLAGEKAILAINPSKTIIIRTSWLYSRFGNNFVKTMLKLTSEKEEVSVVNDQVGSPTYAADLAIFVLKNMNSFNNDNVEVYHFANKGFCSWFDFASEIIEISGNVCKVTPVSSETFKSLAQRPKNSVLNTQKVVETFQMTLPSWEQSLKKCIKNIV